MPRRSSERIKDCPPAGKAVCRWFAGREPVTRCPHQPDAHFIILIVSSAESNGWSAFGEGTRPHLANPSRQAGKHNTASTALRPYPPCQDDKSGRLNYDRTTTVQSRSGSYALRSNVVTPTADTPLSFDEDRILQPWRVSRRNLLLTD